jgi:hypothetical protein
MKFGAKLSKNERFLARKHFFLNKSCKNKKNALSTAAENAFFIAFYSIS